MQNFKFCPSSSVVKAAQNYMHRRKVGKTPALLGQIKGPDLLYVREVSQTEMLYSFRLLDDA